MAKENPTLTVNFLSRLFFCWVSELFAIGSKRQLETDDLYDVCDVDRSGNLTRRLEEAWAEERRTARERGRPARLSVALVRTFWRFYAGLGLLLLLEESSKITQPLMIAGLLDCMSRLETDPGARDRAFLFATGVGLCSVVLAVVHHPYFFSAMRLGMWLRVSCCNLIYRKVLRLDQFAMLQTSTGQVVNLMTNDVQRLDFCCLFLHFLWLGPLEAVVVFLVLWRHVGIAALAGVAALILLSPLQVWIGKLFARLRAKTAHLTDERVKLTSEMIHGMRVVKMYCWEPMFGKIISHIRKQEMARIAMAYLCNVVRLAQFMVHTKLAMLVLLAVGWAQGELASQPAAEGRFTVANVFLCLAMFNAIRVGLTIFVPYSVQFGAESLISIARMQRLLELPERADNTDENDKEAEKASLRLTDFCASWNHEDPDTRVLSDINLEVEGPELIAVVGPVGCGKSSLVMAILGELPAISGSLRVQGTVAYAAQQPWVFAATVRENIIFGREWDQERYEDAVNGSALRLDLEQLPHGDQTLVGERGVSLSGGQRARVGLARVLYSRADIYLLDDPLSAVDAGVAKHLFNRCVRLHLRHTIRVLVTHQLQFLKAVDRILVLQDGAVVASGTYSDLVTQGISLDMIVKSGAEETHRSRPEADAFGSGTGLHSALLSAPNLRPAGDRHLRPACAESSLSLDSTFTSTSAIDALVEATEEETAVAEEEEEERAAGRITWQVFASYFLTGVNAWLALPIFLVFAACQATYILCDWWLTLWMKWERVHELARAENGSGNATVEAVQELWLVGDIQSTTTFLWILALLTLAVLVTSVVRSISFYGFTLCASRRLHKEMLLRLVRAPVRFFDTNSAGRILNRFAKDTGVMDDMLPPALSDFCICSFLVAGNLIVNFVISPWTIVAVAPLVVIFLVLRRYYMLTSRNVKRLESVARSPVFAHVNNTLLGLATLRSSNSEALFSRRFEELQDRHSQSWYAFLVTSRWFGIRLDWLCVVFVIAVCYLSIVTANIDDAKAGLMLTYAVSMLGMFQWCIRQSTEVENHMVSVERIVDYTRLAQEPPLSSPPDQAPPDSWPPHGELRYSRVDFRYAPDTPRVLHGLSWRVRAQEKVGVVGRTGAGKSSLVASLFRLAEPEAGRISIDGRAVGVPMGLHDLRQRISIIPQDPVLFTGTVRWNLDPLERQLDDAMWRALEDVQMKEAIKAMPEGLDSKVAEGGVNLSVGQRQLMCLARALLRNNRILIIDEATANVDPRTDELIQETIRSKFAHCTVLTIAHRLHTVMDSDRIMVLDGGRVVEFDHPHSLLQRTDGHFHQMVNHLESREATELRRLAESAFKRRKVFDEDEEGDEKLSVENVTSVGDAADEEEQKLALLNGHGVHHPVV